MLHGYSDKQTKTFLQRKKLIQAVIQADVDQKAKTWHEHPYYCWPNVSALSSVGTGDSFR
jgi:hypothetical protein